VRKRLPPRTLSLHIGRQIHLIRRKEGLTQSEVGRMCGLSQMAISLYERGRVHPTASTLWQLSNGLGVPVNYWFDGV